MKQQNIRMSVLSVVALAAFAPLSVAQVSDGSFEQTLTLAAPIELEVQTDRGDVTVRAGSAGVARVIGRIVVGSSGGWPWDFWRKRSRLSDEDVAELVRQFEENPPVELRGGALRVGYVDGEWRQGVSMSYEIEVPTGTDIRSRTGSGRHSIEGIAGVVEATSGSGSVDLRDLSGTIGIRTGSGSIRATNLSGVFEGQTGSGSIRVAQSALSKAAVTTGSGSIDLAGVDGELTARTGSGGVTVAGRADGPWNLRSGSGSIDLHLPSDSQFSIDARSGSGGVSTEHPVTVQGSVTRGQLSGQVRGGGPLIMARTGSGGIQIE